MSIERKIQLLDYGYILFLVVLPLLFIVLTGRLGVELPPDRELAAGFSPTVRWAVRMRPYYPMAVQFLLGSLFSAYAVFYSQSATLTGTAVFFVLLIVLLVVNEFLRHRLSSLRLLVSLYALVCFAFFTFFLPVMTGYMNVAVFLTGAAGASTSATFVAFAGAAFAFRVVVVFFLVAMVLSRSPEPMRRFPPLSQAKSLYGCSPNRSAILVPDLAARKRNYTGDHLFFAQEVYPNRMI